MAGAFPRWDAETLAVVSLRVIGALGVLTFVVAAFTPATNALFLRTATRTPMEPAQAIVVLGAAAYSSQAVSDASLRRAVLGIRLFHRGLAPMVVFSGEPVDVRARVNLARELGVPPERTVAVAGAHTTRDEAALVHQRLGAAGISRIILVTDAQHMMRARPLFERSGFEVVTAASDIDLARVSSPSDRLDLLRRVADEVLGRLYYRAAGYL